MRYSTRVILALMLMLAPLRASAFDGQRKGFVMGLGIGAAPLAHWSQKERGISETGANVVFEGFIGYAWDDRNMLLWDGVATWRCSEAAGDSVLFQSTAGPLWRHYYGTKASSLFSSVGAGFMQQDAEGYNLEADGWHIRLGGGYEFTKQVQIGLDYAFGWSDRNAHRFWHHLLMLTASVAIY
jgi:hypothetical protein